MRKVLIFGNSGSGKSTLARKLATGGGLAHLDLDSLAWLPESPPRRMPLEQSAGHIMQFINTNKGFVIEGCYADLLEVAVPFANEIIFLNLPISQCVSNARNRPWEPHKYARKEDQDNNLEMLVKWIEQYHDRDDVFSYSAHTKLYESFAGKKVVYVNNEYNEN
ncbi:MAG: AAA family ATPase [Gammaproteobacteria bacterium]|nr:AAA family ATPase [Gammaproteobacteria bacterium]